MTRRFRKGDVVTIRAVITHDEIEQDDALADHRGPTVRAKPDGYCDGLFIPKSSVKLVVPHFEVGERVIYDDGIEVGKHAATVKAVADGRLWVDVDGTGFQTWLATDARLLEKSEGGEA